MTTMKTATKKSGCDQEGCPNDWTTTIAVRGRPPVLRCGRHRPVPIEAATMIQDSLKDSGRMVPR